MIGIGRVDEVHFDILAFAGTVTLSSPILLSLRRLSSVTNAGPGMKHLSPYGGKSLFIPGRLSKIIFFF